MATGGGRMPRRLLPDVCRNYNRKCGCSRESCEDLHVCFYFVTKNCTFKSCSKAHTLETPRNIVLLERMGWTGHDDIELAQENLRRKMHGHTISVCFAYNTGSCEAADCRRLHVCHRHVRDSCPLPDCDLSHSVAAGPHNGRVLRAAGKADTPITELLRQLADQLRQRPYRPGVCRDFYTRAAGCDQRCMRLHCCAPFTRGQCRYGTKCFKRHNLRDPHNQRVLIFFGWTESQALTMFASADGDGVVAPQSAERETRRQGSESEGGGGDGVVTPQSAERETRRQGSESEAGGGDHIRSAHSAQTEILQSVERRQGRESQESGNAAETLVKKREEDQQHENAAQENRTGRPTEVQRVIEYLEKYRQKRELRERERKERREREQQVMERQERERQELEQKEKEQQEREEQERELQERERQEREQQERERQEREQQEREQQERERQEREEQEREQQERERQEREQQERERREREQQEREQEREKYKRDILEKEKQEKELLEEYTRLMDQYSSNEKTLAAIKQINEEYVQKIDNMQVLLTEFESREQQHELKMKNHLEAQEQYRRDSERLRTLTLKQRECMECSICLGVFLQPLTLGCFHTFCQACIENVERASATCPLCRQPIGTKTRSVVLDTLAETIRD